MKTEIEEFLKQHPEFNLDDYIIESRESYRYGGDYEILVWEKYDEGDRHKYVGCWWCKLWNNEQETTYVFEREEEVHILSMRACIDSPIDLECAYYDYSEDDPRYWNDIEESVVLQYKKDNIENVKKMICDKIMSGEIRVDIYTNDSDCWDAPRKQIKKIYKA